MTTYVIITLNTLKMLTTLKLPHTGAPAEFWCLLIHADASLSL